MNVGKCKVMFFLSGEERIKGSQLQYLQKEHASNKNVLGRHRRRENGGNERATQTVKYGSKKVTCQRNIIPNSLGRFMKGKNMPIRVKRGLRYSIVLLMWTYRSEM